MDHSSSSSQSSSSEVSSMWEGDEITQKREIQWTPSSTSSATPKGNDGNPEREQMFDKVVTPSDVGELNRLVIPQPNSSDFDSSSVVLSCGADGDEAVSGWGRLRLFWTPQLHKRFVDAVDHLGIKNAVPNTIMQLMNVDGLTRENVASHLAKYRLHLKRMQSLNDGGGGGPPAGSASDPATDRLFASSPVPAYFLGGPPGSAGGARGGGGGRVNSEQSMVHMPVSAALHPQQMEMGHFGATRSGGVGQFEQHPVLSRLNLKRRQGLNNSRGGPATGPAFDSTTDDPKYFELDGDTLIQLWMAADLIREEPMEDIAAAYLRLLLDRGILSFSREDQRGKTWYKVNHDILSEFPDLVLDMSRISPGVVTVVSEDEVPPAAQCVQEPPISHVVMLRPLTAADLNALMKFTEMRKLLCLTRDKSNIERLPCDFFVSLESIQALDLSRTRLVVLPSSIGNARRLRYLDLSDNAFLRRLPETIDCLDSMQTLKLRNCPRLVALPKGTKNLVNLRHLDLGTPCPLQSMPSRMGALTALRTLSEFVVGRQGHGCGFRELKNVNHLTGRLCLSRLENVASLYEAEEARLNRKTHLTKLELRWSDDELEREKDNFRVDREVIIEHLRPHTNLQELRILCYQGLTFPSWISHPSFDKLVSITLFKCENCQLLPSLGQLNSLESLCLIELSSVRVIDRSFCRGIDIIDHEDLVIGFPKLQKLTIKSMVNLEEWKDMGKRDFPCLNKLAIRDCPKLVALCNLSNFPSLEYMELNHCSKLHLPSFLQEKLAVSIQTLVIEACPLSNLMEDVQDWHKIYQRPV